MDLFEQHRQTLTASESPLAARMRPRTLEEYVGQDAIVGPGRLLRRAIQADQLSSLLFYGPPGTGKTTLARVIANTTKAHFIAINAVLSGVKEIRGAIATAQDRRGQQGQKTILFVDEVHRFNKAQQDALLPWVENGTVILIGATTENPYFEVNKALVSRSRVFQLTPLTSQDLEKVLDHALTDRDRGYGHRAVRVDPDAADHLVNVANGDARALLNALELAVETTASDPNNGIHLTLAVAEESIQQRAVLYDKEGDAHFDTISAFIKSLRGSDPDATLYWLARMVYAGEDPRFIFRRMLIFAGEDVGLAEPQAVTVVNGCAQAFDRVGLPEGRYPLAQAALYLANCPKSNSVMGFFDALAAVEQERQTDVPKPLKDGSRDGKGFGHGQGYLYPHAYQDHWVEQQYLPTSLQGQVFYQPSNQGYEATLQQQVARRREAQLAALVNREDGPLSLGLTFGPPDRGQEQWIQRAMGDAGERLRGLCDRVFQLLSPQRHHLILDLNATTGLLTWEALRQVPEGGVTACVRSAQDHAALTEQIAPLEPLSRPDLIQVAGARLPEALHQHFPQRCFDGIVGRNALMALPDRTRVLAQLADRLTGTIVLVETLPRRSQRLYDLLPASALPAQLQVQLQTAEDQLYENPATPALNWDEPELIEAFTQAGLTVITHLDAQVTPMRLTDPLLQRWFAPDSRYLTHLRQTLSAPAIDQVRTAFTQQLRHQTVPWHRWIIFAVGTRPTAN
ncbi:MAG: AAA family ATPase [Cyanobacteria bacterium P01_A01_bin.105]